MPAFSIGSRKALAAATVGFLAMAGGALGAGPVSVEAVSIQRSTDDYSIDVQYARTGIASVDEPMATWARQLVDEFIEQADDDFASFGDDGDRPPWTYSLDLDFEVERNDGEVLAIDFDEGIFTGGAHPNHGIQTYNFLMPDGWQVYLPEIFKTAALKRISELTIADLKRQWGGDSMSDDDWLAGGAGPQWDNFSAFLLLADELVIRFPPYQVAAYAAGPQSVTIPLSDLQGLMRKDWRTPVPSFDCAKAGTATEKAICSDVTLARLDRKVAAAYQWKLRYADEAEAKAVRADQRAWLEFRDTCGSSMLCLTASYDDRLKVLSGG